METESAPDVVEVVLESLAAGGDAVGHLPDGRAIFVPFAAPGDRARVRVTQERPRYARGELVSLVEAGASRAEPACPAFGRCGGCAWQHLRYEVQLEAKRAILRDALERIGRLRVPEPVEVTPSPEAYGYRGRARVVVEAGRVGYRRRRSRELEAVDRCPILAEPLERSLQRLPGEAGAQGAAEREWELALDEGGGVRATPLPARGGSPIALAVAGRRLRISPGVFAQGNRHLQDALAEAVRDAAASDREGGSLLELYAGAGTLTLALAARFQAVTAVEAHAAAARDLVANLRAAGISSVRVLRARAEDALRELAAVGPAPDVAVLDPPRAGLAAGGAELLAELGPARIAYLSCDPATLARDLSQLARRGYRLTRVRAFDLFPQTAHVEALAVMEGER